MNAKRPILHARVADPLANITRNCDGDSLNRAEPILHDSSVSEFEAALIKARDVWRGRRSHVSRNATRRDLGAQGR